MQQVIEVKRRSMGANACTMSHYHWLKLNRDIAQRNTTWKRVYTRVHIAWQRFFRPGSGNAADTQCTAFHGAACMRAGQCIAWTACQVEHRSRGTCASPNLFTTRLLEHVQTTDAWAAAGADLAATSAVVSLALLAPTVRHG
jgi:hypothetical protein